MPYVREVIRQLPAAYTETDAERFVDCIQTNRDFEKMEEWD